MFFRKFNQAMSPSGEELERLASSSTKFLASELQNLMRSSHGEYLGKPKKEDLVHARNLVNGIPLGSSVHLIGELRMEGDEICLFFRDRRLDSLTKESAKLVKPKLANAEPVLFRLEHVSSRDKTRSWPSIEITRQKKLP